MCKKLLQIGVCFILCVLYLCRIRAPVVLLLQYARIPGRNLGHDLWVVQVKDILRDSTEISLMAKYFSIARCLV